MNSPDITAGKFSKSELHGQRPPLLRVRKDSHKIKKPPVAPPPPQPKAPPPRAPVIRYVVSPKVIHANPSEFMAIVQRLTGPDSTCSSSMVASSSSSAFQGNTAGAISTSARFASIEQTHPPEWKKVEFTPKNWMEWLDNDQI